MNYEDDYDSVTERENARPKRDKHEFRNYALLYLLLIAGLNVIFWVSPSACNFYVRYCHPIFLNTYGRFTSIFPFSVGEVLIALGILLVAVALFMWIPMVIHRKDRKKPNSYYIAKLYYRIFIAIVLNVGMIMTLNCVSMYHRDTLDPNPEVEAKEQYTAEDLLTLRNYLVTRANALAEVQTRDEDGYVTYDGDLQEACVKALHRISDTYPLLSGWYPKVKKMMASNLMSQMDMEGYYFPFSLEANVNRHMYSTNFPYCYCHELAHTHGYIYENEANFISYLACMESEDNFLMYSGLLSVLVYLENDCYATFGDDLYCQDGYVPWCDEIDSLDLTFLPPGKMEEVEEQSVLDTEVVSDVTETLTETSLQLNGVKSGMVSYSEVVGLLLQYYDGKLY